MSLFKKLSAISITSFFISMPVFANLPNNIEPSINSPSVNQSNVNPLSVEPENVPVLNKRLLEDTIDILHETLGHLYNIDWIFDLILDEKGDLLFFISFRGNDSLTSYLDLSDQEIEALIQDACETIQDELSTYYPISGYVYNESGDLFHFSFNDRTLKLEKVLLHFYQRNDVLALLENKLKYSLDMNWNFALESDTSHLEFYLYFNGSDYFDMFNRYDYFDTFKYLREDEILDFIKQSYSIIANYIEINTSIEPDEINIEGLIFDDNNSNNAIDLYEFYILEEKIELEKLAIDYADRKKYWDWGYGQYSSDLEYVVERLEDKLSKYFDINWQFDIKQDKDGYLQFEVGFAEDKSLSTYRALHNSKIMTFLGQAYEIISNTLRDNYLLIDGTIIDYTNKTNLAEFTLTYDKIDFKPIEESK